MGEGDQNANSSLPRTKVALSKLRESQKQTANRGSHRLSTYLEYLLEHYEILEKVQHDVQSSNYDELKRLLFSKTMNGVSWRVSLCRISLVTIAESSVDVLKSVEADLHSIKQSNRMDSFARSLSEENLRLGIDQSHMRTLLPIIQSHEHDAKVSLELLTEIGTKAIISLFVERISWLGRLYMTELKREDLLPRNDLRNANPGARTVLGELIRSVYGALMIGHDIALSDPLTVVGGLINIGQSFSNIFSSLKKEDRPRDYENLDKWFGGQTKLS